MGGDDNNNSQKPKKSFKEKSAQRCSNFGKFMWNSENRTCMGRTGMSWLKLLIFYLSFYAAIAALWAICMAVFLQTLDPYAPTQQHKYSMLKDNPGMGFWQTSAIDSALIYFASNNESTYTTYITGIENITQIYANSQPQSLQQDCEPGPGKSNFSAGCAFSPSLLGFNCTPESNFGYAIGKPCVLLRINKIYAWDPTSTLFDGTNSTNEFQYSQIPNYLKTNYTRNSSNNYIPVSCQGENDGDVDSINKVTFYPENGFSASFYPYFNQPNYVPPAVMAQFDVVPGHVIMISCKVWTKIMIHDQTDLQGQIHIELYVMNNLYNSTN
jgi:sodium/potassium-transporting ATPase subunit beta